MKNKIPLIIVFGFLLYFNSFFNTFVWDDEEQVVNNSAVYSLSNLSSYWAGSTFNSGGGTRLGGLYYKPLMTTAFSLIYTFFGPRPFFFHLFQVGLHIANSVLLFLIFRHLFKKEWLSFVLAMIFLVHPINVETVVYISALQDTLFFFFGILALYVLVRKENWRTSLLASLFLLLSLFSKETGIVWFAICFLYLFAFKKKQLLSYLLSAFISIAIYSYLRFGVAHVFFEKHGLAAISTMDLTHRLINIPAILFYYLKILFWPVNLAIDQQWVVSSVDLSGFILPLIIDALFIGALIYITVFTYLNRKRYLSLYIFFVLWFLGSFAFHLQLFPLDMTVSERWFYLPLAGILGVLGSLVLGIKNKGFTNKKAITYLVLLGVVLLSVRTLLRTFDWRNGLTLYSKDIKNSINAFDLENNLGVELFRAERYEEAKEHFEKSIKLAPSWWTNYNNLGAYWEKRGELEKAEELYKKSIDNGNYYLAYENYAFILIKQKKYSEAVEFLENNIGFFPNSPRLVTALTLAKYLKNGDFEKLPR